MVRELPLLLNGVDITFLVIGIVVIIISEIIGDLECDGGIPFATSIVVFAITILYILLLRDNESTIRNPWLIYVSEIILGGYYAYCIDDWGESPIGVTFVVLLVFIGGLHFVYAIFTEPVYVLEDNTTITAEEYNSSYNNNIVTYLEEEVEEIPIYAFTTTGVSTDEVNTDEQFVASGYVGEDKVYFYYFENEWGILVQDHVTTDKTYSGLSKTLEEGRQPYLKKIHQYDVTVDKNVVPEEKREREYKRTLNIFCVPENSMVVELGK